MTEETISSHLQVTFDSGSGRAFVTIFDESSYEKLGDAIAEKISQRARSVAIKAPRITDQNWRSTAEALDELLSTKGIRQASFVGLGAGATLAENVALENPKMVRTLVVVDSTLRPHPSRWERLVDAIEENLPFGLPLRLGSNGFNVKAYAHRLRCPLLIVGTRRATPFVKSELQSLCATAPTSWQVDITASDDASEIAELGQLVWAFQDTPAKCPQKNLQGAA